MDLESAAPGNDDCVRQREACLAPSIDIGSNLSARSVSTMSRSDQLADVVDLIELSSRTSADLVSALPNQTN